MERAVQTCRGLWKRGTIQEKVSSHWASSPRDKASKEAHTCSSGGKGLKDTYTCESQSYGLVGQHYRHSTVIKNGLQWRLQGTLGKSWLMRTPQKHGPPLKKPDVNETTDYTFFYMKLKKRQHWYLGHETQISICF